MAKLGKRGTLRDALRVATIAGKQTSGSATPGTSGFDIIINNAVSSTRALRFVNAMGQIKHFIGGQDGGTNDLWFQVNNEAGSQARYEVLIGDRDYTGALSRVDDTSEFFVGTYATATAAEIILNATIANGSYFSVALVSNSFTITETGAELQRGLVVNQGGDDYDSRIEGATDTNLLFTNAGTDRVGIGTAAPGAKLEVNGDAIIQQGALINESGVDSDTRIKGNNDDNLVFVDAGLDRVGFGTNAPATLVDIDGTLTVLQIDGGDASLDINGQAGTGTGNGGKVSVTGGASGNGATGNGGAINLTGGAAISTNGNGGGADLIGGDATGTGTAGTVTITGGASAGASGTAGGVNIDSGAPTGGTAAAVNIGVSNASAVNIGKSSGTIGLQAPTTLQTGSAAAGDFPLKFVSGTLMATAEVGAIEFLTDKYYGTITTGALRKQFAFADTDYGEMYTYDKAVSLAIVTANAFHAYHLIAAGDIVTGLCNGWTFNAGRVVDANITSITSSGGGSPKARITCSGVHSLTTGDIVVLTGATAAGYNDKTRITTFSTTVFDCDDIPYVADENPSAANVVEPAHLKCTLATAQVFRAAFCLAGASALAAKIFRFELVQNVTGLENIVGESVFSGTTVQQVAQTGLVTVNTGDKIWMQCLNVSGDTTDFVVKHFQLNVARL